MELLVLQNQQNPLSQNHKNLLLSLSMLLLLALLHPLLDPLFLVMGKQLEMVGPLLMVPYYMVVLLLDLKLDLLVHLSLLFMLVLLVPFLLLPALLQDLELLRMEVMDMEV